MLKQTATLWESKCTPRNVSRALPVFNKLPFTERKVRNILFHYKKQWSYVQVAVNPEFWPVEVVHRACLV